MTSVKKQTNSKPQAPNYKHGSVLNFNIGILNLFVICILLFGISLKAVAAELSFQSNQDQISVGQEFELVLFLNTEKENINAIEGKINYSDNLEIKEIRDGGSIITLWIKKPQLESGQIIFAGITPGGFIIEKGKVFSIIFQVKKIGNTTVSISNARILLNDGNGTPAKFTIKKYILNILERPIMSQTPLIFEDKNKPVPFKIQISSDPNIFENRKFLVFVAQDKQSGIDYYEVKEGWFGSWKKTESPHLLNDQKLRSYIYVRAVDKTGNIQMATMPPQVISWYMNYWLWIIIIICCALAFIYLFYRLRRLR